jgi:hypothetical protein
MPRVQLAQQRRPRLWPPQVLHREEQARCEAHAAEGGQLVQLYGLVHKLGCVARQWVQTPGAPRLKQVLAELKREAQRVCLLGGRASGPPPPPQQQRPVQQQPKASGVGSL